MTQLSLSIIIFYLPFTFLTHLLCMLCSTLFIAFACCKKKSKGSTKAKRDEDQTNVPVNTVDTPPSLLTYGGKKKIEKEAQPQKIYNINKYYVKDKGGKMTTAATTTKQACGVSKALQANDQGKSEFIQASVVPSNYARSMQVSKSKIPIYHGRQSSQNKKTAELTKQNKLESKAPIQQKDTRRDKESKAVSAKPETKRESKKSSKSGGPAQEIQTSQHIDRERSRAIQADSTKIEEGRDAVKTEGLRVTIFESKKEKGSVKKKADAGSTKQAADSGSTKQKADAGSTNQKADASSTKQKADAGSTKEKEQTREQQKFEEAANVGPSEQRAPSAIMQKSKPAFEAQKTISVTTQASKPGLMEQQSAKDDKKPQKYTLPNASYEILNAPPPSRKQQQCQPPQNQQQRMPDIPRGPGQSIMIGYSGIPPSTLGASFEAGPTGKARFQRYQQRRPLI